jgi:putative flippase GtrA
LPVLSGLAEPYLSYLVGGSMNKFLIGFIAGVFVGVLLAPVFSPEVIVLAAIILLVLATVLMYLFHRGVIDFQEYE